MLNHADPAKYYMFFEKEYAKRKRYVRSYLAYCFLYEFYKRAYFNRWQDECDFNRRSNRFEFEYSYLKNKDLSDNRHVDYPILSIKYLFAL